MQYHIVFKTDADDFYSTGKTYKSTLPAEHDELLHIANCLTQYSEEHPKERFPHLKFLILYPIVN